MSSPAEMRLLVRMIQYEQLVSDQELRELLLQSEVSDDLFNKLLNKNIVDEDWVSHAKVSLRKRLRQLGSNSNEVVHEDRSFGQLALRRSWVSVGDLEAAILEQQRLKRVNLRFRIGEIMLQLGCLDTDQVRQILECQGYRAMACGDCEVLINVSNHSAATLDFEDTPPLASTANCICPQCGGELVDTTFLDTVQTDYQLS